MKKLFRLFGLERCCLAGMGGSSPKTIPGWLSVDVPDLEIANVVANVISQEATSYTSEYEILELGDNRFRREDEWGFEEKYRRID